MSSTRPAKTSGEKGLRGRYVMPGSHNDFFFEYYEARVAFVEETCLERIEGLLLMCCYLDALAGYRFGGKSSGERFRKFILEHGNTTAIWQKISLMSLYNDMVEKKVLFPAGFDHLLGRQWGHILNFCQLNFNPDIDVEELERRSEGIVASPWSEALKRDVEQYEYTRILWRTYRTNAVHETSIDADAAPMGLGSDEHVPFYRHINMMKDAKIVLEAVRLRIPPKFILATLKECLNSFSAFVSTSGIEVLRP